MLQPSEAAHLDKKLTAFQRETGQQMALLTVPTLSGEDIDDVAVRTFEKWQLGEKGKDNGVLVVLASNDHKVRIEVGYGLEGQITDALASRIIRSIMTPAFRDGDYSDGLERGFDALMTAAAGKVPDIPDEAEQQNRHFVPRVWTFWLAIWLIFTIIRMVSRGGRRGGFWGGGPTIFWGGGGSSGWGSSGGGGGFSGGGGGRSGGGGASGSW